MSEPINRDADTRGAGSKAGTPRWVKVTVVTAAILVVLVVVVLLVGGGNHGPGRHTGSAITTPTDAGVHTPQAGGHE